MRGHLEAVSAVNVVPHLQSEGGGTKELRERVLFEGRLLKDDHGLLIGDLRTRWTGALQPGLPEKDLHKCPLKVLHAVFFKHILQSFILKKVLLF